MSTKRAPRQTKTPRVRAQGGVMSARSRRSRLSPGKHDRRKPGSGKPILASRPGVNTAVSVQPPALTQGQGRCPVCRNGAMLTVTGRLRVHHDLFGAYCNNRVPEDAQPVQLGDLPEVTEPARPTGACHECDKRIPPGRLLCGRCMARRI